MFRTFVLASCLLVSTAASCGSAGDQGDAYKLKSGDRIKITVFGHDELSGEFAVSDNGIVSLPLVQSVNALGLTTEEVEKAVTGKLKPDYLKNPIVNVEIIQYRPVYILGEVQQPGAYAYTADLTLSAAIALAGGYTYRAKMSDVMIERIVGSRTQKIHATKSTIVQPGDVVEVPERFF